jgi:MFS family permease
MNASASPTGEQSQPVSAWAPLRSPMFRWVWLATLFSNIGGWVHDTTSGWVMATLTPSPLLVSLVSAVDELSVLMLVLIAGALADIVDRRKFIVFAQTWMLITAAVLALLSYRGTLNPTSLLLLTLAMGVGSAFAMPALSASVPELVPMEELPAAIALSSIAMNVARAIGPALGGAIISRWGPAFAYLFNALSFVSVILVFALWRRTPTPSALPAERFMGAMRAGLRYTRGSPEFQSVLLRALSFFLFANTSWALLPLIAKVQLHGGPGTYGILLGAVGAGAIAAAMVLPGVRRHVSRGTQVLSATMLYSATMLAMAWIRSEPVLIAVMLISGAAWITVLSALQVSAQTSVPSWVRARALSVYIMVFSGGLFACSIFWGWVATRFGVPQALTAAAGCAVLAALATSRIDLKGKDPKDLMPSAHWPQPVVAEDLEHDRGPVMTTIEYRVGLDRRVAFLETIQALGQTRRRDGAIYWDVFEDAAQPGRYLEMFLSESWLEHLREHERVSFDDRRMEVQVRAFHVGEAPTVRHYVGGVPGKAALSAPSTRDDE